MCVFIFSRTVGGTWKVAIELLSTEWRTELSVSYVDTVEIVIMHTIIMHISHIA